MLTLTPAGTSTLPQCERCQHAKFSCRMEGGHVATLRCWCAKEHYDVNDAAELAAAMRRDGCPDFLTT